MSFQDTGTLQAEIIYMVADLRKNVCVVGDDDQSIYVSEELTAQYLRNSQENILGLYR